MATKLYPAIYFGTTDVGDVYGTKRADQRAPARSYTEAEAVNDLAADIMRCVRAMRRTLGNWSDEEKTCIARAALREALEQETP